MTKYFGTDGVRAVAGQFPLTDEFIEKLEKKNKEYKAEKGWFGFSDRYWFSSIVLKAPFLHLLYKL